MLRYAKIEDDVTKRVTYGSGTDTSFYKSIGMIEMDIEQSDIDQCWYVKGYAPRKSEQQKQLEIEQQMLAAAKAERSLLVSSIVVEVDGLLFDGNEDAQQRMSRTIAMADSLDESVEWVLHDDSVVMVTIDQLKRACKAAIKKQSELWLLPYTK